jgi:hypothetical protein
VQTAESKANTVTWLVWGPSAALTAPVEHANAGYGLTFEKNYDNNISQLLRRSTGGSDGAMCMDRMRAGARRSIEPVLLPMWLYTWRRAIYL